MVRTQIQLTETQAKILHEMSKKKGISVAELIRLSVDSYLENKETNSNQALRQKAKKIAGRFDGSHDLSVNHDKYWEYFHEGYLYRYLSLFGGSQPER